ncbi:MAG TPA: LiaF domain-containing protein [Vicinamibacteria bacterium]|nr:LiaF domain-containing protein [Vicinamibacteria bacterium]
MRTAFSASTDRSRTALALVLIAIGLIFTLDSAGVLGTGVGRWWPLLLIGAGIVKVRQPREDGQRAAGTAFLLLGGLFQLTSLLASGSSWALLMVAIGVFLLRQGVEGPRAEAVSESPYLDDMALIGYLKRSHPSVDFRGGSVTAVIGGVEVDLRKATLTSGTAYLDVFAFWGGIEIKVPTGWKVDARVVPVMGAFEDKVDSLSASGGPGLVVRGHVIMGAVSIRS